MLSNFKIGTRLFVSFAIALFFIVAIGVASFQGMGKLRYYIFNLTHNQGKLMEYAQRSRVDINLMRRFEKDAFINMADATKMEEYRKKWADVRKLFNKRIGESDKLASEPDYTDSATDKKTLETIKRLTDAYAVGFIKVYDQVKAGEITTTQDANNSIAQFKEATHQSEKVVEEFAKKMDQDMEHMVADATGNSRNIQMTVLTLAIAAILITWLQGYFIIRSIISPLRKLVSVATVLSTGNLTPRIEVTSMMKPVN